MVRKVVFREGAGPRYSLETEGLEGEVTMQDCWMLVVLDVEKLLFVFEVSVEVNVDGT